jgi:hypothetical protein
MMQTAAHSHVTPSQTQTAATAANESPIVQLQSFKPVAGQTSSLVASARSHFSTRPSTFLSSPPSTSFSMPKAAAPETTFPDPFFRSFYPLQRRAEAAPSLRDSYSQDAEMWGECVSPRQPLPAAAPMITANDTTAPVNSFDLPTDAFDLVSPGGDVVQRSGLQKTDRADDAEQRWHVAASSYDRGVESSQRQREQPLKSNSPETIAIIEATTVRGFVTFTLHHCTAQVFLSSRAHTPKSETACHQQQRPCVDHA